MSLAEYRVADNVDVSLVDPFATRLLKLLELFGGRVLIASGRRSLAEQQALYDRYLAGLISWSVAKPGTSKHEHGQAADLRIVDPSVQWREVHLAAATYGLRFPLANHPDPAKRENWHVETDPAYVDPPEDDPDMTPQQFADAIGARIPTDGPFAGKVCVDLLNDPAYPGQPVSELGTSPWPLAAAIGFTHQELKMRRLGGS